MLRDDERAVEALESKYAYLVIAVAPRSERCAVLAEPRPEASLYVAPQRSKKGLQPVSKTAEREQLRQDERCSPRNCEVVSASYQATE